MEWGIWLDLPLVNVDNGMQMICLTFDTDWMTESSMSQFLDDFPLLGQGTFFAHEAFKCLAISDHEIGPHPFISNLGDWQQNLKNLSGRLGKPARGTRPHSCVFSHMIGVGLNELGFEYVSQANNLFQDGLRPFRHPWGIWELPIYYMDNMDFWTTQNWPQLNHVSFSRELIQRAVTGQDLYVFDFHPLHVALNTRTSADYQSVKGKIIEGGVSPFDLVFPGRGARVFFNELCQAMRDAGSVSLTCGQALDRWKAV